MTDIRALSRGDIAAIARVCASASRVKVEIADGAQLAAIQPDWVDLVSRAAEPNAFMNPQLLRIAAESYPQAPPRTLLAWTTVEGRRRLTGVWAFAVGHANKSMLPLRVLTVPPFPYGYLATPVVDHACLEETLDAMLDAIAAERDLPKIVVLSAMGMEGPTMAALARVLAGRDSAPCILQRARRPKLQSDLEGRPYLEKTLSGSSRKKLRQHRRRLAEKGALTSETISAPGAMSKAIEEFLLLEASGWKGRQGTALLCSDTDAAFFRSGLAALAQDGCASIHALYLDRRPVSMQLVLRAGHAAFTWKTAYDEEFHDFSPGMLLFEDYTTAFLGDGGINYVDSCALDDSSYMSAWTERQPVADLWIDARRGGSAAFRLLGTLETIYRELRTTAKQQFLRLRRGSTR